MRLILFLGVAVLCVQPASVGRAGQTWVEFVGQTETRLVADSAVGSDNPDEKDFAWGDVDNDGDVDLVAVYKSIGTTTGRRRNVLFLNEGGVLVDRTAEYVTASTVLLADGTPSQGFLDLTNDRDVAMVDVNGDGWLDIVTATTLSGGPGGVVGDKAISHPRIYINLGDDPPGSGIWQGFIFDDVDRVPTMPAEPRFTSVSAGDVDGDDDADLYFTDHQQGGPRPADVNDRLWINDGAGHFTDETSQRMTPEMVESNLATASAISDMNGDGAPDIMKVEHLGSPSAVFIHYNDPLNQGFFIACEYVYTSSPMHASVSDLNNDNMPDLVVSDHSSDRYQLNVGNGPDDRANFAPSKVFQGSSSQFSGNSVAADLNRDGFNDVLIAGVDLESPSCINASKIYRNLGDGHDVTLEHQGNLGISPSDFQGVHDYAVFDIDGDDWPDIVIGRCTGTRVYMNIPNACSCTNDMNEDGLRNGDDIRGFVDCLIGAGSNCGCAESDANPGLDINDITFFVVKLISGESCSP